MTEKFDIAGYCRISVDEEKDEASNVSIENQKAIIADSLLLDRMTLSQKNGWVVK